MKINILPLILIIIFSSNISYISAQNKGHVSENGIFADDLKEYIYFKTHDDSFNRRYYVSLRNGRLWIKPNKEITGLDGSWTLLGPNGLPFKKFTKTNFPWLKKIKAFSLDGRFLVAISESNWMYNLSNSLDDIDRFYWENTWGSPFGKGQGLNIPVSEIINWSSSIDDNKEEGYYEDMDRNKNWVLVGSVFILKKDGKSIHFADPWTPADFGYILSSPVRGRFISINMSVSGSTMFLINEYGDMYTRQNDFDIIGGNPFISYSFKEQKKRNGVSAILPRRLPVNDWYKQPKINGKITDLITVFSIGKLAQGSETRILRVEGYDNNGNYGFYEKKINENDYEINGNKLDYVKINNRKIYGGKWVFNIIDDGKSKPIGKIIEKNTIEDKTDNTLSESGDYNYEGEFLNSISGNFKAQLLSYNLFCSLSKIRIYISKDDKEKFVEFPFHSNLYNRYKIRTNPGIDYPINQIGYIEIPDLKTINDNEVKIFIKKTFNVYEKKENDNKDNRTFIKVAVEATRYRVLINGLFRFNFSR
jgi:hypothetical protein